MVDGSGPSLLGRDWLQHIRLDWKALHQVGTLSTLAALLDHHKALCCDELDTVKGTSAKLHVNPQCCLRFYKPRPVPYAMRNKIEQETDQLKQKAIIQPVDFSDWATPIVSVLKSDGLVHICRDYKLSLTRQQRWIVTHYLEYNTCWCHYLEKSASVKLI